MKKQTNDGDIKTRGTNTWILIRFRLEQTFMFCNSKNLNFNFRNQLSARRSYRRNSFERRAFGQTVYLILLYLIDRRCCSFLLILLPDVLLGIKMDRTDVSRHCCCLIDDVDSDVALPVVLFSLDGASYRWRLFLYAVSCPLGVAANCVGVWTQNGEGFPYPLVIFTTGWSAGTS